MRERAKKREGERQEERQKEGAEITRLREIENGERGRVKKRVEKESEGAERERESKRARRDHETRQTENGERGGGGGGERERERSSGRERNLSSCLPMCMSDFMLKGLGGGRIVLVRAAEYRRI